MIGIDKTVYESNSKAVFLRICPFFEFKIIKFGKSSKLFFSPLGDLGFSSKVGATPPESG